ncbi:MAG: M23 family metallopeptidase [Candidatus Peribacteraceae bacterium]|nr:M23 family metallopeptidase [Candidatus Peribacteraceae bacterium]
MHIPQRFADYSGRRAFSVRRIRAVAVAGRRTSAIVATAGVLLAAMIPLMTFAFIVPPPERDETAQALEKALEGAAKLYRSRPRGPASSAVVKSARAKLIAIGAEKRRVRLKIASSEAFLQILRERLGVDPADPEERDGLIEAQKMELATVLRTISVRGSAADTHGSAFDAVESVLLLSLGDVTESALTEDLALRERLALLQKLSDTERIITMVSKLRVRLKDLQREYLAASDDVDRLESGAAGGSTEDAIRRVFEEVHQQVIRLQGELARIDARLRMRAERTLIEKGLREARPGQYADGIVPFAQTFAWPAFGPITAGYLDEGYKRVFGIPHLGMDIGIGQGSPVVSAADGVVFLARDGGGTGYSYVLVGHRGGYATLYGHLSHFSVSTGEDVRTGQLIGLSGGQPGSHGAGPTTTGPHLHFEVIKNGANIDPQGALP